MEGRSLTAQVPENLKSLHIGEEELRQKSLDAVQADPDNLMHFEMVECVMDYLQFVRMNHLESESDEELLIIQLLGARVFNSLAAAIKLILSGYYQAAASLLRDVLETGFLLDYFSTDRSLIQKWKQASEADRKRDFNPAKIRTALDGRDGFKERKREEHYKQLSSFAAHPTFPGLGMLRPEPKADALMGPFLAPNLLEATIQELVKVAVHAGQTCRKFFKPTTLPQYRAALYFLEKEAAWVKQVYGKDTYGKSIGEVQRMIAELS
jgi:hypothetical protein